MHATTEARHNTLIISNNVLCIQQLGHISALPATIVLSEESQKAVAACRTYLDNKLKTAQKPIYGINTGFGSLCKIKINDTDTRQLQHNLLLSHACGMGDYVPEEIARLMLLLKIKGLSKGHSGISNEVLDRLVAIYNKGIAPRIHTLGSLGASGDLVPLSELSLPLLGLGEVYYEGKVLTGAEMNSLFAWEALSLQSKEGLALLNGTQFMSSYATAALLEVKKLLGWAITIAAMSFDAFHATTEPLAAPIHRVRNLEGQALVASTMASLLKDSPIQSKEFAQVQDPYSFRCTPQVLGASFDAFNHIYDIVLRECNAVTDNPLIFEEEDAILSGGNFHGQPLALTLDYLAIAAAEIANLSERRTYQLVGGLRGLPEFLVAETGLNSGLMIPQYAAASIVNQNKQLCTPASVDSIPSCNGQEDYVSMGANAATKAWRVCENVRRVLAIELLTASQALYLRAENTSPILQNILDDFRSQMISPGITTDAQQVLSIRMQTAFDFLGQHYPPVTLPFRETMSA